MICLDELRNLIKKLRGKESLRDAAKRIGLSHSYLSILEKGIDPRSNAPAKPSPDTLKLISEAYNYPYEKLLQLAGYIEKSNIYNENEEFEYYRQKIITEFPNIDLMFKEMSTLTAEDLKDVYEYIKFKQSQQD